MTNPSAPETRTDAPEAKEAAAPAPSLAADGAKSVSASDKLPAAGVSPKPGEVKIPPARTSTPRSVDVRPGTKLAVPPPPKLIEPEILGPVLNHAPPAPPNADPSPHTPEVMPHPSDATATELPPSTKPAEGVKAVEFTKSAAKAPRAEVKIRLFGRTDVGQVREHNEDNFIVADLTKESRGLMEADRNQVAGPRGTLLGVCDGMGGAAAGEVASQLAVDIIYQRMAIGEPPNDHDDLAARLVHAIEAAGLRIFSEAKLDRTRRGMGTTATIASLMDDHLFFGQVGDSRAYILRGERLVQVTRDQSLVNQLIEAGQLTEEEAETFEHNNIILQALGTADSVQVDLTYVVLRKGDTLLLCSDGLSGMVRNDEIREVLRSVEDPLEVCKVLTDRANQAGGHDNITVVIAKFDGPGLDEPSHADIEGLRYQKYQLPDPPSSSAPTVPEPSRRLRGADSSKNASRSSRPPARIWAHAPDSEGGRARDDHGPSSEPASSAPIPRSSMEDPILIPTEGAPQWLVIMMIASAVACVTIAGYYLLH
jgi:PPM family protein phosphatase